MPLSVDAAQFWTAVALQIPLLAAAGWLISRGTFVTGREADARVSAVREQLDQREKEHASELQRRHETLTAEVEYRERLRIEERDARLRAEERLAGAVKSLDEVTQFLSSIEKEIIRGGR